LSSSESKRPDVQLIGRERTLPTEKRRIKVLVIDDSALMRKLLRTVLERDDEIEVVGSAHDPFDAREKIKQLNPDVLTLDIEMPKMDGLTFLRNLMRLRPMPVVMVSSLTDRGADATLAALQLGAVDFVSKPKIDLEEGLEDMAALLVEKVKHAATARPTMRPEGTDGRSGKSAGAPGPIKSITQLGTTDRLIAIGSSTGGTEAVADILAALPPDAPGIVIAQHIPEVFSQRWAARMDAESAIAIAEATDGDQILIGHAYVAPGGRHLRVERSGAKYICRLGTDAPVNRHRPSVDVLFRSVASEVGRNAVGVILTGMGGDGAEGLLEMLHAGSPTIAQDRATSVVWGMPGEAVKRGAAQEVLALDHIAARVLSLARGR
jgi:two-component system chemotaxis response regulator CheB